MTHPPQAIGLILALDQGTTNSKALLVDAATGAVVGRGSAGVAISYPRPGWVEQDADQLFDATMSAAEQALATVDPGRVAAVSISNQRESVVCWDAATGEACGPVLGWQDARTADECSRLAADGLDAVVLATTGLSLDAMFSAPKMRWLLDRAVADGHRPDDLRVGTVDTWLVHRLTGEFLTESGNASRTMLMDLRTRTWAPALLEGFGVPATALATIVGSDHSFGRVRDGLPIPGGVPVATVLADSHSALYFHGQGRAGQAKATYGTGSSVMLPAALPAAGPVALAGGVAATCAWETDTPVYAREGNVVATGAALAWAARMLTDGDVPALGELAGLAEDAGGVSLVPAFSGLGAPYFDRGAVSVWCGMTAGTTRAQLARSAFEAVAHQVADVVEAMTADGAADIETLHADGGATASALLMQRQADLLGRDVQVSGVAEASALGAALLAARSIDPEVAWEAHEARRVVPSQNPGGAAADRAAWRSAVSRARHTTPAG
ncbi:FGGY family carbohydrate kinase [Tessaracoccus palaemonis]|uniref:ATP:glycerol 3-phosphotransferase n=1 Tax=Tessaracoccus palaemonis TaxID=2829499 RepID=A0ABX8SGU4_9ACTN|nr:FGGY family carbohydrate kinase [Tessaracoccus palaemonis]QXT62617.1 hypothetical protein KDB89_12890 [Tessaracoccus palaemonis]